MTMVFAALAGGVVLGTVFQRVTGMGFALLMAPFFAIVFGPYEGILLMNLGGAVSSLLMLSRVWRDVDWGRFLMLSSAAIPSGIIAGLVITRLDQPTLGGCCAHSRSQCFAFSEARPRALLAIRFGFCCGSSVWFHQRSGRNRWAARRYICPSHRLAAAQSSGDPPASFFRD